MKFLPLRRSAAKAPKQDRSSTTVAWTGPAAWVTRGCTGLLFVSLLAGPAGLLVAGWLLWSSPVSATGAPRDPGEAELADERTAVQAFAGEFVVTWLTTTRGQERRLAPYLAARPSLTLPETPWTVRDVTAAGITRAATSGSWAVTVAATIAESDQAPTVRRYFQVPVVYRSGAMTVQSLPAPVAGPMPAQAPRLAYSHRAGMDNPASVAAREFVVGLLVGGDVTRVISPSSGLRAISPSPYTAVKVTEVRVNENLAGLDAAAPTDGRQLRLLVTATLTPTAATGTLTAQYPLTLTARSGRWEISSLDPAPAIATAGGTSPAVPAADPAPALRSPVETQPAPRAPDSAVTASPTDAPSGEPSPGKPSINY